MHRDLRDNSLSFNQYLYRFLWKLPITYNPASGTFHCFKSSKEKWVFLLGELLTFIVGVGTSGFLLVKQIVNPTEEIGIAHFLVYTTSVLGTLIVSIVLLQLMFCQEEMCVILNRAKQLHKVVPLSDPKNIDLLGYLLHSFVFCSFAATFVMPCIVYFNLDPIFMCCRLLEITPRWKFIEVTFRVSVQTTLFCAALRSINFGTMFLVINVVKFLEAFQCSLVDNFKLSPYSDCSKNIASFQSFYIYIEYFGNTFLTKTAGEILSVASILQIIFLFALVRSYELVYFMWPMYGAFILGGIFVPTLIHFGWIQLGNIHFISVTSKHNLRRAVPNLRISVIRKLVRKKVRSLQVHNAFYGLFNLRCFALTSETEIEYFSITIEGGINALLSIPSLDIRAFFERI